MRIQDAWLNPDLTRRARSSAAESKSRAWAGFGVSCDGARVSWVQLTTVPRERGDGRPIVHAGRVVWFRSDGGLAYDARTNEWRSLDTPSGWRDGGIVVSIGDDLIVWSGMYPGQRIDATGASHRISEVRQPSVRKLARCAWTGRELVVWGGWNQRPPRPRTPRLNGAAYDAARDVWRKLPKTNAPTTPNGLHLWTGSEFWIWAGEVKKGTWKTLGAGCAYDPAADTWRSLADLPGDPDYPFAVVRLTDAALMVRRDDLETCSTWGYEPRSDLWEPLAPPPEGGAGPPRLLDCGGRIVLLLAGQTFEYLVMRDAWARLPSLPNEPHHLLWLDGALLAFMSDGPVYRLVMPT